MPLSRLRPGVWLASLRSVLDYSAVCIGRFKYTCPILGQKVLQRECWLSIAMKTSNWRLVLLLGMTKLSIMRGIFYSVVANGD